MRPWKLIDSKELYNVDGWGKPYFDVNERGMVTVAPKPNSKPVALKDIIDELQFKDLTPPVLLRFPDILDDRIETIANCFARAAEEYEYKGEYYSVYPIKVNQARPVVEEIMRYGARYRIGLEAGSKPELHAVIAFANNPDALIICNGYKDEDYIELALLAQKMGKKVFVVVEKLNEIRHIIEIANRLDVRPNIGIRIKLATSGAGKWEDSGGDRSKFGLMSSELLEAISILESEGMLDCARLLHFHLGSQITKIRKIKNALREASQFYVQAKKLGCAVDFFDIGGGLGVDYDGSRSFSSSSVNYSVQEYVNDAVATLVEASDKNDLPHPNLITESGRALSAYHSVLIISALEATGKGKVDEDFEEEENDHELIVELRDILKSLTTTRMLEAWHDAQQIREESLDLFSLGMLDLRTRAVIERLYWAVARKTHILAEELKHAPEELRHLSKLLTDKYFCNFSLFQSLPDSWAIDQIFPIMPIHRLDEKPTRKVTIQDITCDSDGKIEKFIGDYDHNHYLPAHDFNKNEPYYIGVFLVGAYQEILGDLHNLFGDANAAHVKIDENGYEIQQIIEGETVAEALGYVQYDSKKLVRIVETWVAASVKEGKISSKEGKGFLSNYRAGLYGKTYLE